MTAPFGPPGGALPPPSVQGPPEPPGFMQPKYLIALGVCAALILVAGIVAVVSSGGDGSVTTKPVDTLDVTVPSTTRVLTTTPVLLPATIPIDTTTTSTTSTTSTSTTSTTSTLAAAPIAPVANAGDDLAVDAGQVVNLTMLDLSEPNQSVVWRQVAGPDVTDGRGRLVGVAAVFVAPDRPTTLRFEVSVTGRGGDVATDELRVDVYEQADRVLFVDAVDGSSSGDGSRLRPYRDLAVALAAAEARGNGTDLYLRTADTAYTIDATVRGGSSLYGGYDADWVRTATRPTLVEGHLSYVGRSPFVIASIDLRGLDETDEPVLGVSGAESFLLEDSVVRAGDSEIRTNIALLVENALAVDIVRSEIIDGGTDAAAASQ